MKKSIALACVCLMLTGCGRYFGGPIEPAAEENQTTHMTVGDDGTITYSFERLEISLRPMRDAELNRQFQSRSQNGAASTNPYTYGNWRPMGENWTPPKYTVFLLKIKNYAYPKVAVDPLRAQLDSETSRRTYDPLAPEQILEFYYGHIEGYAGNSYRRFQDRRDVLRLTLYQDEPLFSGQEKEGYIVFPQLDPDVKKFAVSLSDIAVKYNYAGDPVETIDLSFRFEREVYKGYQPPASLMADM